MNYLISLHDALPISTKTNIPFYKNNEFDYAKVLSMFGGNQSTLTFIVFLMVVVFIVAAVSNGANITDGIDGLRSEEHTSELQSRENLVCRLLLEKKR